MPVRREGRDYLAVDPRLFRREGRDYLVGDGRRIEAAAEVRFHYAWDPHPDPECWCPMEVDPDLAAARRKKVRPATDP